MSTDLNPLNSRELIENDDDDEDEDFTTLPVKLHSYKDVFRKKNADQLPIHRAYDLEIDIHEGKIAPFMPMYPLSEAENTELLEYIDENLKKGFIQPSKSSCGAPILFVPKKDGSLRMCVDFRGLNKVTIKNRYPLPLINDLLDRMISATVFSKIDLRGAYNLVRIRKGDEWKTAFRTKHGLYEYNVMPFGLCNAPAAFQAMMDDIFKDYIDDFVVVLLDDICIYSKTVADHHEHIIKVLTLLRQHSLYAKLSKCEWFQTTIELLGHNVGINGVSMCGDKVKSIADWPAPTCVKELQSFLGLANYYRRFIEFYSQTIIALTVLLKKNAAWEWKEDQQLAFDKLKAKFTSYPVLRFPDHSLPFVIECDASDFAIGSVLSQIGTDKNLHPVAFYSRKFTPPEINYYVYDKELLAIIASLLVWRQYLCGARHKITIFTDHRNLVHFQTAQHLTRKQVRYSLFISEFDFSLQYRPGSLQGKPDSLSRRSDYGIKVGDSCYKQQFQTLLQPSLFTTHLRSIISQSEKDSSFEIASTAALADMIGIKEALSDDELAKSVRTDIANGTSQQSWVDKNGLLFFKDKIYVPEACRNQLMLFYHDAQLAGHKSIRPTVELIGRQFFFPLSTKFITNWIESCQQCIRSKSGHRKPYGELQPLEIATKPWQSISMDFVVKLPKSEKFDSILVVVDRMTKMAHFIACNETITSNELAVLVRKEIFSKHGLPIDIVSDRGAPYVSKLWRTFLTIQGIKSNLSTSYHPETDGQTERVNSTLKTYLRLYTNYNQDNWVDLLDQAEFAYNNTNHSSINTSPFYANYGFNPRFIPTELINSSIHTDKHALQRTQYIQAIQTELIQHLTHAAEEMKKYADRKRQAIEPFSVGEYVYLSTKNISTQRPSKSLDFRNIGPLKILERVGDLAYKLELPTTWKQHDVFHVSLLTKSIPNVIKNRIIPAPLPILVDGSLEHWVSDILDVKVHYKKIKFLVKWEGAYPQDNTWEPEANVRECEALSKFITNNQARMKVVYSEERRLQSPQKKQQAQPKSRNL